jgi:hypothetical protein
MRNTIKEAKRSRGALTSTSKETKKIISEEDIRNRAFMVYRENDNSSLNKLINRFYAERELSGYYMYSITNTNSQK